MADEKTEPRENINNVMMISLWQIVKKLSIFERYCNWTLKISSSYLFIDFFLYSTENTSLTGEKFQYFSISLCLWAISMSIAINFITSAHIPLEFYRSHWFEIKNRILSVWKSMKIPRFIVCERRVKMNIW